MFFCVAKDRHNDQLLQEFRLHIGYETPDEEADWGGVTGCYLFRNLGQQQTTNHGP